MINIRGLFQTIKSHNWIHHLKLVRSKHETYNLSLNTKRGRSEFTVKGHARLTQVTTTVQWAHKRDPI